MKVTYNSTRSEFTHSYIVILQTDKTVIVAYQNIDRIIIISNRNNYYYSVI